MEPSNEHSDFDDVKSLSSSASASGEIGVVTEMVSHGMSLEDDAAEGKSKVGMVCDIKNLWEGTQKCHCCINWVEEYPEDVSPNPEETDAVQEFALIVRNKRNHGSGKAMVISSIVIQSPLLKPLLEDVFEGYEGITAGLKKVVFNKPFAPFFYRWDRFKKAVEEEEHEVTRAHAELLYKILFKEMDETITTYHDLLSHGVITFSYLWTLFKPGDILYCKHASEDAMIKLQNSEYQSGNFRLLAKYVDWSGSYFGYATKEVDILTFDGTKPITDLEVYPIRFDPDATAIESKLTARGKRFEELQGYHYKLYEGSAEVMSTTFNKKRGAQLREKTVDGRIIIDAAMYNRHNPTPVILEPLNDASFAPSIPMELEKAHNPFAPPPPPLPDMSRHGPPSLMPMSFPPPLPPGVIPPGSFDIPDFAGPQALSEEHYPLCTQYVKGYSLQTKNWARFCVDSVKDIVWDDRAFDSLVLPPGYKELILSFTKSQNGTEDTFDDVIEGKGQGIVMLLTGEPGVGKTLTAESVAEHMRVPLYSMSAAQLGVDSATVEQALGDILELASKWKAILLLDETEVFLEQRSIDSLERNKLVSIFLRMLEYYRGVLFLTTNRVSVLDKALESRIHLKISYPELDRSARLQVWHNLIELLPPSSIRLDTSDLDYLSQRKMNGRQIKNVIKAAQLLASEKGNALSLEHVHTVLRITQIGEQFGITA